MNITQAVMEILCLASLLARNNDYEFVTPEVILMAMCRDASFAEAFKECGGDVEMLSGFLEAYMDQYLKLPPDEKRRQESEFNIPLSASTEQVLMMSQFNVDSSGRDAIGVRHLFRAICGLTDSYAVYYIRIQGIDELELLEAISDAEEMRREMADTVEFGIFTERPQEGPPGASAQPDHNKTEAAVCLNDTLVDINPLIGREEELERTIQILCRKDKNNPLHIGEPGVGKTAITYGLVTRLKEGNVPEPIRGARVFAFDLGSMLAGTQYRGEFEKKMKRLLEQISQEEKPIVYIDEIHNIVGAGGTGESSFDVSNMLKPYLAQGHIRFIGATTYEEYKKYFEKNKGMVRRFQNVEIKEPTIDETVRILEGLKGSYEKYHGVRYQKGVLEYAARMSVKYINERFLPDKAIDLIDEAGAYRRLHPIDKKIQTVGKDVIDLVLQKICRVPVEAVKKDENSRLASLEKRMLSRIFGQDEAVAQVVNAVKFSKAGLLEDNKPLSSFLFAGPTGVGKTEVARSLAEELGVELVRFDMSEYGEKHAVSKLIGAPAGYVGYEEGGLLTEAIRRNPSCVLLFDEIEKAHSDIFNILLQIMDYATLTDNQGRKADFRNVIIIMTSNAGANKIGRSRIGFDSTSMTSAVVSDAVKNLFQPEFRNRLNAIVTFRGLSDDMAELIADKKLKELEKLLVNKKIEMRHTKKAVSLLKSKGVSPEYGAREIDRIIQNEVKTLLVDEILFGQLKKGGRCRLDEKDGAFIVRISSKKRTGSKEGR